ncbi:unnamed protein product [marine sediment metagenome]|uniref:Uncharacterized protein n=1 Tax=marine sediment metagenome TaxID=412755 RepID=X0WTZ7_9ZZZZ
MPEAAVEMVKCPQAYVGEAKHDVNCQCCYGIGWVEDTAQSAPQQPQVPQSAQQIHIHPAAPNQQPQMIYLGAPQAPQYQKSKLEQTACWIFLAYVTTFVMISLIMGAMMFL